MNRISDRLVRQNVSPLTSLFGDHAYVRFADTPRLDVAVIGCDMDIKVLVD